MNLDAEDWLEVSEFPCKSRQATIYVAYSKSLEKRNPKVADILKKLPSNESIAMDVMKTFPTVIGHSGLDVSGDAKRDDIKDTSVKVFLGLE